MSIHLISKNPINIKHYIQGKSETENDFGNLEHLNEINDLKYRLNLVKTKLDDIYKLPNASNIMRLFDPFSKTNFA